MGVVPACADKCFGTVRCAGHAPAAAAATARRSQPRRINVGANPFQSDNSGQQANQADTTKKKRIRKPLESYFFNDSIRALPNFSWTINRDYNKVEINPLDTTLATWRIDYPFYKEGVGHAALGGLGQATLPYN